jgi:hypothetical protein
VGIERWQAAVVLLIEIVFWIIIFEALIVVFRLRLLRRCFGLRGQLSLHGGSSGLAYFRALRSTSPRSRS